jgi:hypothetical protein
VEEYGKRLRQAASQEYKRFWSGYRCLVTISGLSAPVVVWALRGGGRMLSFVEVIESGTVGLSLSLIGTYLYSRRKGAENLDAGLHQEIESHRSSAVGLQERVNSLIERSKIDPIEEHKQQQVRSWLAVLQPQQQDFFGWLLSHGEVDSRLVSEQSGMGHIITGNLIQQGLGCGLIVSRREIRAHVGIDLIKINPSFETALYNVLHIQTRQTP